LYELIQHLNSLELPSSDPLEHPERRVALAP
jgi:hypothetical protein